MQAKLLVVGGSECEQEEFLLSLPAIIGRGRDNQITLAHQLVSRKHCEIFEGEGGIMVRDLGSLNGTYVGSQQIEGNHLLQAGDLLTIGIVTFRMALPESDRPEAGLRLESVLDDEDAETGSSATRLAPSEWNSSVDGLESETVRESPKPSNPRRAK